MKNLNNIFEGLFDVDSSVHSTDEAEKLSLDWVKNQELLRNILMIDFSYPDIMRPIQGLTIKDYSTISEICALIDKLPTKGNRDIHEGEYIFNRFKKSLEKRVRDLERINRFAPVIAILDRYALKKEYMFLADENESSYRFLVRPKERMIIDIHNYKGDRSLVQKLFDDIKKCKGYKDINIRELEPNEGGPGLRFYINIFS